MGSPVSGLRDSLYRDLRREYQSEGENSFLYRFFWTEAVTGLLKDSFPQISVTCPIQPEHSGQIRAQLAEAIEKRRDLLLRPVPEKKRRKASNEEEKTKYRDFWEDLWLNDAGCRAGLLSDTDYYLWLVEYLAKYDLCYKDTSMWDGRWWLIRLLREGWLGVGEIRNPGFRKQGKGKDAKVVFRTAQLTNDLQELAKQLETRRDAVASRLHGLEEEGEDYLPWLTSRLEKMALHIRIRNWFQNSGYPLNSQDEGKPEGKKSLKQDFILRLFEAYCNSGWGGSLFGQDRTGGTFVNRWQLTDNGFCLPDEEEVAALQAALEGSVEAYFYIPLAVDLHSGCVFFLAGRDIYRPVYEEEEKKWKQYYGRMEEAYCRAKEAYDHAKGMRERIADQDGLKRACARRQKARDDAEKGYRRAEQARRAYEGAEDSFCFDYLRLDRAHLKRFEENPAGGFRVRPVFHKQAGVSFQVVLREFIDYCNGECNRSSGERIPREAVKEFNQDRIAGIPESFFWAFDEKSRESEENFYQTRNRPPEDPTAPRT